MKIFMDYEEGSDRLILRWNQYHPQLPLILGAIPGCKAKPKGKNPDPEEAYYYLPATWDGAQGCRRALGDDLELSQAAKVWGRGQRKTVGLLRKLANAEDAELKLMPELLPEMYELIDKGSAVTLLGELKPREGGKPRPFQKADIAFMASRKNSGNFNHPGLGKTIEVIGAIAESGSLNGSHLIACPLVSKESVWQKEWQSWVRDVPCIVTPEGRAARTESVAEALALHKAGKPFALIVNPAMLRLKSEIATCITHTGDMCLECGESQGESHRDATGHRFKRGKKAKVAELRKCHECQEKLVPEYPELHAIAWDWFVMDEIQKMGVYDTGSKTYKGLSKIKSEHSVQMSGTPFAGKAINTYNLLHLMDPVQFSNKMQYAETWLNVTKDTNYFAQKQSNGRAVTVGELRSCPAHPLLMSDDDNECPDCQALREPFYAMLSSWAVRRTKSEYLTDLPDKMYQDIEVTMTPKQEEQYRQFEKEAEITIDKYELGAIGVLAEYTRLKQFAGAVQTVEVLEEATIDSPPKYKLTPTEDCPKLPVLWDIMEDLGITADTPVGGQYEQLVIFSESAEMVKMVAKWIKSKGIAGDQLIGATPQKRRSELQNSFQGEGGLRVLVVSTQAAGVSINLDRASTVVFLDETWNPDDQEQAEDRCHRGSRMHQVRVISIRTKDSIQEHINKHVRHKSSVNKQILDIRKKISEKN